MFEAKLKSIKKEERCQDKLNFKLLTYLENLLRGAVPAD